MDEQTWDSWVRDWQWVLSSMKRKGARVEDLEIAPPVPQANVAELEREYQLVLPGEFVDILTRFSSSVRFYWSLYDPETDGLLATPPEAYAWRIVDSGGDYGYLWSFENLPQWNGRLQGWMRTRSTPERGARGLVWRNKTAFNYTDNGDLYAFDTSGGRSACPVIYLDHEHGPDHGMRLGLDFVGFVTRWSNLGCPEFHSLDLFHDPAQNVVMDAGETVENWKRWVSE
jgi:hypothetical protein